MHIERTRDSIKNLWPILECGVEGSTRYSKSEESGYGDVQGFVLLEFRKRAQSPFVP